MSFLILQNDRIFFKLNEKKKSLYKSCKGVCVCVGFVRFGKSYKSLSVIVEGKEEYCTNEMRWGWEQEQ